MDDYGSEDSGAMDPVFNNSSDIDESWRDIGESNRESNYGGAWAEAEVKRGNSFLDQERQREARNLGRAAENGASKKGGNGQDAKSAENSPFLNSVTGKNDDKKKKKGRFGGLMRTIGPSGIVISLLGVIVVLVAGTQWLFPFALVANGLDQFNTLRTSMNRRTSVFMRLQLDTNRPYTGMGLFGNEKFQISKGQSKKFRKNGIIYSNKADGGNLRVLYYKDDDTGKRLAVVADEADVERVHGVIQIPDADGEWIEVEVDEVLPLKVALDTNESFFNQQNKATRTIRGHIAGWFDTISKGFHNKIKNTRAKFVDLANKEVDDTEVQSSAKKGILPVGANDITPINPGENNDDGTGPYDIITRTEKDEKGNEKTITELEVEEEPVIQDGSLRAGMSEDEVTVALENRAQKLITSSGKEVANMTCMVLRTLGSINMTVAALHVIQILNYTTGFLESIDQAKAGEGGSAVHYYMGPDGWSKTGPTLDAYGKPIKERGDSNSMLAQPTRTFFGGAPVTVEDKSVQKFNVETQGKIGIQNNIGSADRLADDMAAVGVNIGSTIGAYRACNAMDGAIALIEGLVELKATLLGLLGTFVTGGASLALTVLYKAVKGIIEKTLYWAAVRMVMVLVSGFIVKSLANWLMMDLITDMTGEDAAYALSSGFNIYAGRQMQSSSGLPGNREEVARQFKETQEVIAEEARYDRLNHSPFDVTNKNTFLGSLAYSMIPIATTMKFSSLFSTVSQVANTVGSSVTALFPAVNAAGMEAWYQLSATEDCPSLSVLGVVADAYCNPYFVSDYNTIEEDPAEVFLAICKDAFVRECDAEGEDLVDTEDAQYLYNPEVREGSEYSKWIISCAMRESQFGFVDERIAAFTADTGNAAVDAIANSGIQIISGGLVEVAQAAGNEYNLKWNTGERCSSDDEQIRMFSRYSEDQRLLESEGLIEESSTTAFMRKYYEKNPLDDSIEGVIARYSGMSDEKVEETLNVIAYVNYIANYHPEERRQFNPSTQKNNPVQFELDDTIMTEYSILVSGIVYADVRNRTWTV